MARQRNSSQKKEQEEMTARDLIHARINKVFQLKFKTTTIRILAVLEKSIEDIRESVMGNKRTKFN